MKKFNTVPLQHIGPACLPSKGEDFTAKTATAIGWGKLSETDAVHSDVLREVNLEVISNVLCKVRSARRSSLTFSAR